METIDNLIEKFKSIPEELWLVREFTDNCGGGCVMYHGHQNGTYYDLHALFLANIELFTNPMDSLVRCEQYLEQMVNNGDDPRYQQPTPKQRIIAALMDIKASQHPTPKAPEVVERIVYVMVDSTVKELSGQLTNN